SALHRPPLNYPFFRPSPPFALSLLRSLMGGGASSGRPTPSSEAIVVKKSDQAADAPPETDPRLPFANFRELFTLKNFWKTIKRNDVACGKTMLAKYLSELPENQEKYKKLASISGTPAADNSNPAFEAVAGAYLKVFDDVINSVEEKPADVQAAIDRLKNVGKMHRAKSIQGMTTGSFQAMEGPFIHMAQEILQDRFNDKAESLFRKFFQFCLKYLVEGFNG
ncbi:hypothetical protein PMAYCL1PPCAC_04884, partial [Pristionchus mayeri]